MALAPGTKLGPYEIVVPLGAGGMGEVYRARDTKLGREVALKLLPAAFAANPARMARFQREAQILASLNHPGIASIYGLEDSSGVRALVMELVEGPTLAERITPGPIPLAEALPIARQICEALEYAHERGIIHRDLKPANIKVAEHDTVKVLDFGLAKALEAESQVDDNSSSPTTSHLETHAGVILGTPAYMSPEQAKGKSADRRADIWAFGCVLFEMLTGERAFHADTATEILAAVIRGDPDWSRLVAAPPRVRDLLSRSLQKDPRQRLQAIGDARIAIEEILSEKAEAAVPSVAPATEPEGASSRFATAAWWIGWLLAAFGGLAFFIHWRKEAPAPAIVSQIVPPADNTFAVTGNGGGIPVLSPDGQRLAFVARDSHGKQLLWVLPLNAGVAQSLAGTDDARYPFWSADSHNLAFYAHGMLNRIDASGGPPLALCDAPVGRGGTWGRDGTILFTPNTWSPLFRVPDSGGTPQPVTRFDGFRQDATHRWPQFLPDGKHFLFFVRSNRREKTGIYAASLEGGEPKLVLQIDAAALYAPPGYLLFVRDRTLLAQHFDAGKLALVGDVVPLADHLQINSLIQHDALSVSDNGLLIYQAGSALPGSSRLLWFDAGGKQIGEVGRQSDYLSPRLSPDGKRLAYSSPLSRGINNLWLFDISRGIQTRLTFSTATDFNPTWSPDGNTIAFASNRDGNFHLYQQRADGSGQVTPLLVDAAVEDYPDWSADGSYLFFERTEQRPGAHTEIWALPLSGDRKPFPVVQIPSNAIVPVLSPDGKWVAYTSDETGATNLFVVPFRHGSGKWQISSEGGFFPRWRRDGKVLYYVSRDFNLMAAEVSGNGDSFSVGLVRPLFTVNVVYGVGNFYDVTRDGKSFLVNTEVAPKSAEPLTLVVNWTTLLKK
jgi:Tol biopolymer transport system component